MSKIGKQPIQIPSTVKVEVKDGSVVVSGPKGTLVRQLPYGVYVEIEGSHANVTIKNQSKIMMSLHGTIRSIISNNVKGVSEGWNKKLELVGTGFRAEASGKNLTLIVGYSHPVKIEAPEGISFKIEKNIVTVEGSDKEIVGKIASEIRAVRPPEPYKGKGIKYIDEVIRRKPGKAAAKATTA
jgi:large subunit ribosomal protein L6